MATEKRLIDANALIKKIDDYYNNSPFPHPGTPWRRGFEFCAALILNEPTVDAVEVVHGRWKDMCLGEYFMCSECDFLTDWRLSNYCPNCGAKMDGDGNG